MTDPARYGRDTEIISGGQRYTTPRLSPPPLRRRGFSERAQERVEEAHKLEERERGCLQCGQVGHNASEHYTSPQQEHLLLAKAGLHSGSALLDEYELGADEFSPKARVQPGRSPLVEEWEADL